MAVRAITVLDLDKLALDFEACMLQVPDPRCESSYAEPCGLTIGDAAMFGDKIHDLLTLSNCHSYTCLSYGRPKCRTAIAMING